MPRYKTEVAHDLGQQEALARVKSFAERARGFADFTGEWLENVFDFRLSTQGVTLTGTLRVEDDALKFEGKLPLIAMPFVSWISRALKKSISQPAGLEDQTVSSEERTSPIVLFLHIPKAAGQTLGEYIYNQSCIEGGYEEGLMKNGVAYLDYGFFKTGAPVPEYVPELMRRNDLRAVIGHFQFGLHEFVPTTSTYITVLRNPVDRVASLYFYAKLADQMSLEEFALTPPFKEVDNDQTRRISGIDPPIGECTRAMLDQARENLRRHFSVVGTTERFDEMLPLLKRKFDWSRDVVSYPRNVNAERPRSLPQPAIDAIRKRNELDFELWEYAGQLLDQSILDARGPEQTLEASSAAV
jgi:hypothetical protein